MPAKKQQSELPLHPEALAPPESSEATPREAAHEVSFEDAIERLSEIVEALESSGLPLEQSLKLFEEGVQLARKSQARLDNAERKVQELLAYDEGGKPIVEEFDPE